LVEQASNPIAKLAAKKAAEKAKQEVDKKVQKKSSVEANSYFEKLEI